MSVELAVSTKKKNRLIKESRRRHPEISKEIILLWEELRQKVVKAERKHELCEKIVKISKKVLIELIKQKTTARVFESVIEFGSEEHRWTIFEVVKCDLLELCKGKYSYFVIMNMLKYGTKDQRLAVFGATKGHVVELLTHNHASKVVEVAYDEVATSSQRREMEQEFYGKTFMLFKGNETVNHLSDVTNSTKFDFNILKNIHSVILPILTKGLVDLSLVQRVLYEYFGVIVAAKKEQDKVGGVNHYTALVEEIVEMIQEQLIKLCNTREGTKLAMLIYWECNAKSRKKVLQTVSEVVLDLSISDNSHLFVLTLIDQTDDVKVLEKFVVSPLMNVLDDLAANVNGRKIIQFLINGRDKSFISTLTLSLIMKGDGNPFSKKDTDIRSKEVLQMVKKPLLSWLSKNIDNCLEYSTYLIVATSILTKCLPVDETMTTLYNDILIRVAHHFDEAMVPINIGTKRKVKNDAVKVTKKKVKHFAGKFDEEKKEETEIQEVDDKIYTHLLESSGGQVLMRSLFTLEKEKKINGFSTIVMETLQVENMLTFLTCNRAAFFLVNLLQCGNPSTESFLKENLKQMTGMMAKSGLAGVKLLYTNIFKA